ncbi:flagellin N-terminal helical domain-containing protein [Thermodesulfatator autotrophicus]|uniref:Flagellin n=1 Tax=Thermodesulfatator autotrophicus TaxID=1795632 RepID=A0A177EAY6_9BACT|nr:flagellin [Thermodesulfatator autotrophicus]OAG28580.1 hypothetical protein TH606_01080 [Thermodesulfatator autotrophicus]
MPMVVNTNVFSINAQRNLDKTQSLLQRSLQRLSSGLRINSAKDDAAGLAIATRMQAQIKGLAMAMKNANDGISLAQTAEGALDEYTSILQRMRELAVQARNATNTDADRESLNAEFQQLKAELDRIANTTSFNNRKILDGTFGKAAFQVGPNVGELIELELTTSVKTKDVGRYADRVFSLESYNIQDTTYSDGFTNDFSKVDANGEFKINSVDIYANTGYDTSSLPNGLDSAKKLAAAINQTAEINENVTATALGVKVKVDASKFTSFSFNDDPTTSDDLEYTLSIMDEQGNWYQVAKFGEGDPVPTAEELADLFNAHYENTGVRASVTDSGDLILTADDGRNIVIRETLSGASDAGDQVSGFFDGATRYVMDNGEDLDAQTISRAAITQGAPDQVIVYKGGLKIESKEDFTVHVNYTASNQDLFTSYNSAPQGTGSEETLTVGSETLEGMDILTVSNIDKAIKRIDQALEDISSFRADLGAIQNRLESTIRNLASIHENLSASRSRIMDADFAAETANLTKAQILQQAGTAVLAQANMIPQQALTLLQG